MVQSIQDFNFFCCPECIYRTKEEISFQAHAIQNHEQSKKFFHNSIQVKEEVNRGNEIFKEIENFEENDENVKSENFDDPLEMEDIDLKIEPITGEFF